MNSSPVFVVSNVLLIASPPALTLAQVGVLVPVPSSQIIINFVFRSRKLPQVMRLNVSSVGLFSGHTVW